MIINPRQHLHLHRMDEQNEHFAVHTHLTTLMQCWEWQADSKVKEEVQNMRLRLAIVNHRAQRHIASHSLFFSKWKRLGICCNLRKKLVELFQMTSWINRTKFENLIRLLAERLVTDYCRRHFRYMPHAHHCNLMQKATMKSLLMRAKQIAKRKSRARDPRLELKKGTKIKGALMRSIMFENVPQYFAAVGSAAPIIRITGQIPF
ncbi:hypothetical protein E3P84_00715 [Wallemia ichthyophaga]|nr:hypothetical protein E3P84_00715 [Wallemia ichthyophaga]TIB43006.1 hypothetical protein E3P83_00978 [Wallemia ichthyophaga]